MDLVAGSPAGPASAAPAPTAGKTAGPGHYTCPMHLAFGADDAEVRCPECHMRLVPREPEAPAGLAAVALAPAAQALGGLETAPVERASLGATLRAPATLAPSEERVESVTLRYSGWVDSVAAWQTGQSVERGQLLATLYSVEAQGMEQVFLDAIRWAGKGDDTQAAARDVLGDARRRLRLAGVAEEDIEALAKRGRPAQATPVRSPLRGVVARRGAVRGAWVQAGTELFQIVDLSTVWALVDVPEAESARLRVGQRAAVTLAAYPGERFEGRVAFLAPSVNPVSRTLQARVTLANPGLRLRPGLSGVATLRLDEAEALTVPRDAVVDTGESQHVFVAEAGGRFVPRRVALGAAAGGRVVVATGQREGERVATGATFLLDAESRLRAAAGAADQAGALAARAER
jgi:RND family efflux transporter MFP subunit